MYLPSPIVVDAHAARAARGRRQNHFTQATRDFLATDQHGRARMWTFFYPCLSVLIRGFIKRILPMAVSAGVFAWRRCGVPSLRHFELCDLVPNIMHGVQEARLAEHLASRAVGRLDL